MNTAIGAILRAFRYPPEPFGSGGAWLVTGHRGQDPGAGPVTALATPAVTSRSLPAVSGGVDRAIRVSTAVVVLAVAGIAAYISYWHAYAVVREYGETGVTAQLEPATIDGLVYASSMVILYAARHDRPVPRLARWMLALGILASLAVNVAQGWSHGLVGAVVAAWPAVSLVGSYELLAWIIRTAAAGGPDHVPAADHHRPVADQARTGLVARARTGGRCRTSEPVRAGHRPRPRHRRQPPVPGFRNGRWSANQSRRRRTGPRRPGGGPPGPRGSRGPCGPGSRLAACGWYQRRGDRDRRRRGGRLPCQRSGRPADIRAQARGDVRQDLPPLGAQPDGRSPAEPGTGLSVACYDRNTKPPSALPRRGLCFARCFAARRLPAVGGTPRVPLASGPVLR